MGKQQPVADDIAIKASNSQEKLVESKSLRSDNNCSLNTSTMKWDAMTISTNWDPISCAAPHELPFNREGAILIPTKHHFHKETLKKIQRPPVTRKPMRQRTMQIKSQNSDPYPYCSLTRPQKLTPHDEQTQPQICDSGAKQQSWSIDAWAEHRRW